MRVFFIFVSILIISKNTLGKSPSDAKLDWLVKSFSADHVARIDKVQSPFAKIPNTYLDKKKCLFDEAVALEIEQRLIHSWAASWKDKNIAAFGSLLGENSLITDWKIKKAKSVSPLYDSTSWTVGAKVSTLAPVTSFLKEFFTIESVQLDFVDMEIPVSSRTKNGTNFAKAKLLVRFDIRGIAMDQSRRNDTGTFLVNIFRNSTEWKIQEIEVTAGQTIAANRKLFEENTLNAKLDSIPTLVRTEAIRRGGFALSVADFNNDLIVDLFVGTEKSSYLLKGRADGTFALDTDNDFSTEKSVKTAMFTDLDNDGWQDLVLVHFVYDKLNTISLYRNTNGHFVKSKNNPEKNPPDYPMPAAIGDFDADGFIDMYVGFPGVKDFTNLDFKYSAKATIPTTKSPEGIYFNNKRGEFLPAVWDFKKKTNDARLSSQEARAAVFPHSAIAVDYDNDGHQDIIVMDDRGGISPVFKNIGNGKFEQVAEKIGVSNHGYGMGVAVADYNNDGAQDIIMTNVDFTAAHRLYNSCRQNHDIDAAVNFSQGLTIYKNTGKGQFVNDTRAANLSWIGEGAGGAEFIDFDNDGWQDIYVVNGLWSGTTPTQDLSSYFVRAVFTTMAWDRPDLDYGRSHFMSILSDHNGPLDKSGNAVVPMRLSMGGFQRNRLFHNNRDGTFSEIGYIAGVDSLADGYVVAKADLNKDGFMDLILRNADPGTKDYLFSPVQLFLNKGVSSKKSILITLQGRRSNRDGIASKIIAKIKGQKQSYEAIGNNGAAQSEKTIHVGLGDAKKAETLEIHWPSGEKTLMNNVPAGTITIKEPTSQQVSGL